MIEDLHFKCYCLPVHEIKSRSSVFINKCVSNLPFFGKNTSRIVCYNILKQLNKRQCNKLIMYLAIFVNSFVKHTYKIPWPYEM